MVKPIEMKIKRVFIVILITLNGIIHAQIFSDSALIKEIKIEVDNIYNFEFEQPEKFNKLLQHEKPDHPVSSLFNALLIYWENFPVHPESEFNDSLVMNLTRTIDRAQIILDANENDTEGIFFNLIARLFLIEYYADNGLTSKVIPYISKTYKMLTLGNNLKETISDFYFSSGLYNYYREAYPKSHPVYKPVTCFFPDGNMELGLKQLDFCGRESVFLAAESISFLSYIYINFEKNYIAGHKYALMLNNKYPNNPLYISYRIRSTLLNKEYEETIPLINMLKQVNHTNDYFKMMTCIYEGIVEEKLKSNYNKAEALYKYAIDLSGNFGHFSNNRISYAYFGLARIYLLKNKKQSKHYRNIAEDLTSYSHLNFD